MRYWKDNGRQNEKTNVLDCIRACVVVVAPADKTRSRKMGSDEETVSTSFLCSPCKENMCDDCRQIAEEYQELLNNRTFALITTNSENERLKRELATMERTATMYKEIAHAGVGDIIAAWIDKEISQILKAKP